MATLGPNLSLIEYETQSTVWYTSAKALLRGLDGLVQPVIKDKDLATPPGSPANGDMYIVAGSPTGAWTGWTGRLARYQSSDGTGWESFVPKEGWRTYVQDEDCYYRYDGSVWGPVRASNFRNSVAKTTTYTATVADDIIYCTAASAWTLTLPAVASSAGLTLTVKKTDSTANAITLDGNASETIDGATTFAISSQYQSVSIHCDGATWWVI